MNQEQMEEIFNKQDYVKVKVKDKDGNIVEKEIRNNIFRPVDDQKEYKKRWNRIHKFVKQRIVHTGLKVLELLIGKYLIKDIDDIPKESCNNLIRISYHSYIKGLEESYKRNILDWNIKQGHKQIMCKDDMWKYWLKNNKHCHARILLLRLWLTEVLEDTFDRGMMDIAMIESYHQIHSLYKGKVPTVKEYRMYNSRNGRDIKYFIDTINVPVWEEKK